MTADHLRHREDHFAASRAQDRARAACRLPDRDGYESFGNCGLFELPDVAP